MNHLPKPKPVAHQQFLPSPDSACCFCAFPTQKNCAFSGCIFLGWPACKKHAFYQGKNAYLASPGKCIPKSPAQENASQKRIPKCIAPIITWFTAAPKPAHRSNSRTMQRHLQPAPKRTHDSDSSTWNSTLQQHPAPPPTCQHQSAHAHTQHTHTTWPAAPCSSMQQHPPAAPACRLESAHHSDSSTLKQHPAAVRAGKRTRHSNSSTLKEHLAAALCIGTSMPAPKRTHHPDSSTLQRHQHARKARTPVTAAPSSSTLQRRRHARSKAHTALWQPHPQEAPSAAPCSSYSMPVPKRTHHSDSSTQTTLRQHPATAPACPERLSAPMRTHHSSSSSLKQHLAADHTGVKAHTTLTTTPASNTLHRHQHARSKTQMCNSACNWSKNPHSFPI